MKVVVREAEERDRDAIVLLLNQMHESEEDCIDPTPLQAENFPIILNSEGRDLLVAEQNGVIVGTIDIITVVNLSRGGRPWSIIENLVVREDARRNGIGRMLMTRAFALARQRGSYKVQLVSNQTQVAAQPFYRSLGGDTQVFGYRWYLDHKLA